MSHHRCKTLGPKWLGSPYVCADTKYVKRCKVGTSELLVKKIVGQSPVPETKTLQNWCQNLSLFHGRGAKSCWTSLNLEQQKNQGSWCCIPHKQHTCNRLPKGSTLPVLTDGSPYLPMICCESSTAHEMPVPEPPGFSRQPGKTIKGVRHLWLWAKPHIWNYKLQTTRQRWAWLQWRLLFNMFKRSRSPTEKN